MAPTTAPKVFCTASPTFRAISVPPSSSKAASSSSAAQTHSRSGQTVKNHRANSKMENDDVNFIYQLKFLCCGNRHRTLGQGRDPTPFLVQALFLRSRNHRNPPHKRDSGALCRWAETLLHIYGISVTHKLKITLLV